MVEVPRIMRLLLCCFLIILTPLYLHAASTSTGENSYWNVDGDFSTASQKPFSLYGSNSENLTAPWQTSSWALFAFSGYPNGTRGTADAYSFNVSQGVAHAWVKENRRVVDPRTGIAGYSQGIATLGGGYIPLSVGILGRDTILVYGLRLENTSISTSLSSLDEDGLVFDLILQGQYDVNGTTLEPTLVVDFYVQQDCGPLNGACSRVNDTTLNHSVTGHVHYFSWRIHSNLQEGVWVSDVVNLRWYLENSVHRAFCWEAFQSDSCTLPPIDASLMGLTATAEAFGGSSGFALSYEYLLQANDCGTGRDAGNDFNHSLRINDFTTHSFSEVAGWLGVGSLYKDDDDYYQFNVSEDIIAGGGFLRAAFVGADSISLYSADNPPLRRAIFDTPFLISIYNFSRGDHPGDWYIAVHRTAGFGFYSFTVGIDAPDPPRSYPATCSLGSPLQPVSPPWPLVAALTVIALTIVAAGRLLSRKSYSE